MKALIVTVGVITNTATFEVIEGQTAPGPLIITT